MWEFAALVNLNISRVCFTQAFHLKVFRTLEINEFASADEEADCVFEHAFHLKVFYTLEIIELSSADEEAGYVFEY